MFKKLYRYFFPVNVDSLIKGITNVIINLEDHAKEKLAAKDKLANKMAAMQIEAQQTHSEILRAQVIKRNLETLMSVEV